MLENGDTEIPLASAKALLFMIDDVIFCRRPLSHLDGRMSSSAYHKLEGLHVLNEVNNARELISLSVDDGNTENCAVTGIIENASRGQSMTIKYHLRLSSVQNSSWIIEDFEIS
jgi:hypothetical protein